MISTYKISNFEWIDVLCPTDEDLNIISQEFNINKTLLLDSIEPGHLPKYECIDDLVFLMFRIFDKTANNHSDTVSKLTEKISVFYKDNFIITIHRDEIDFINKAIKKQNFKDIFEMLMYCINQSVQSFDRPINIIADKVEEFENHLFIKHVSKTFIRDLYKVKKQIYIIDRLLNMTTDLIPQILMDEHFDRSLLQDIKENNEKLQFKSANLVENINNILNLHLSIESNKANDVMKVLTIFSVFFLPATFLTGIYGMNLKIPEVHFQYGYLYFWIAILSVCSGIFCWLKYKRWI
jgi:magnesium transporter